MRVCELKVGKPKLALLWTSYFACVAATPLAVYATDARTVDYLPAITASRESVVELLRKEGLEGASVAVTDENGLVWLDGYGYADVAKAIGATGDTVYGAGAVAMLVTALAALRDDKEHGIRLDQTVAHYLPEFSIKQRAQGVKPLTLRHLLSHHSGLPYGIYKGMWAAEPATLEQAVHQLQNEYAAYPPETLMTFSLANYVVAGRVLEKVHGLEFAELAKQSVFQPLGMHESGFKLTSELRAKLAQGYKKGKSQPVWQTRDTPAMGLYSSARDIAALLRMVLNDGRVDGTAVWSAAAIQEFLTPQFPKTALDLGARYGLGWNLGDNELNGAGRVAWRHGATLTHRARVVLLPDVKLGVVVFTNSAKGYKFVEQAATRIARLFAERRLGHGLPTVAQDAPALVTPPTTLAPLTGPYATRVGYVALSTDVERLKGDVMGWTVQLQPRADGWFYPRLRLLGILSVDLELLEAMKLSWQRIAGQEIIVSQYKGQNAIFAQRLNTQTISPAWRARLGSYVIDNPDDITQFMEVSGGELRYEQGVLYLAYKLPLWIPVTMRIPLRVVNDNEAVIPGLGTGLGETVRVAETPQGERLIYAGYVIRRAPESMKFR